MLHESLNIVQVEGEHRRRWFNDDYFDLIVWFDETDLISGFQLCYNVDRDEHAITWHRKHGYSHNAVDSGEEPPGPIKMTPVLVANGMFNKNDVLQRFIRESQQIDQDVAAFVVNVLEKYPQ